MLPGLELGNAGATIYHGTYKSSILVGLSTINFIGLPFVKKRKESKLVIA